MAHAGRRRVQSSATVQTGKTSREKETPEASSLQANFKLLVDYALESQKQHGHPLFYELCEKEKELHSKKNRGYAGGGDALGNFNRGANILSNYPTLNLSDPAVAALMYCVKHIDAVFWYFNQKGAGQTPSYDVTESLGDISVYMKIIQCILSDQFDKAKE